MGTGEIGINGFGRSRRLFAGAGLRRDDVERVAVKVLFITTDSMTDISKYDSVQGQRNHPKLRVIFIRGKPAAVSDNRNHGEIPWLETGAEVIDELTEDEDKAAVLLKFCYLLLF